MSSITACSYGSPGLKLTCSDKFSLAGGRVLVLLVLVLLELVLLVLVLLVLVLLVLVLLVLVLFVRALLVLVAVVLVVLVLALFVLEMVVLVVHGNACSVDAISVGAGNGGSESGEDCSIGAVSCGVGVMDGDYSVGAVCRGAESGCPGKVGALRNVLVLVKLALLVGLRFSSSGLFCQFWLWWCLFSDAFS